MVSRQVPWHWNVKPAPVRVSRTRMMMVRETRTMAGLRARAVILQGVFQRVQVDIVTGNVCVKKHSQISDYQQIYR